MRLIPKNINKMSDKEIIRHLLESKIGLIKNKETLDRLNSIIRKNEDSEINKMTEEIAKMQDKIVEIYETRNDEGKMADIEELDPREEREMFYQDSGYYKALCHILEKLHHKIF